MGRRNRRKPRLENLTITNIAAKGKGIVRHNGKVIFVENAVPGDVADVQIVRKKKDFSEGYIVDLKTPSPHRVEAFCKHFGVCGGCKWQYLAYDQQVAYKQQIVQDAFQRIGKLDFPELLPIIKADPTEYYRNKMEFTFSNRRWFTKEELGESGEREAQNAVGFHVPRVFDKIVDIEHCHLQGEPSNTIRNEIRRYAAAHALTFYDIREHHGLLRNLIIRISTLDEVMVIVSCGENQEANILALMEHLKTTFPDLTSLHYVVNTKRNDTLYDQNILTFHGRGYIYEQLGDLKFKISPKSFFQTNSTQAVRLYQTVLDFAELTGNETVYDLYTGTGSIGIFVARHCKQVIGIEEIADAITDAHYNAQLNGIANTHFYVGDVRKTVNREFMNKHGQADVVITDPPRAGMHPEMVEKILRMSPKRIVYVSCNPATQARDLQTLAEDYTIEKVQPVDMFPHTYHIENVVLLKRKVV